MTDFALIESFDGIGISKRAGADVIRERNERVKLRLSDFDLDRILDGAFKYFQIAFKQLGCFCLGDRAVASASVIVPPA